MCEDYFDFENFKNILHYTLLSAANGFTIDQLVSEWNRNELVSLDDIAAHFKHPTIEMLIQDSLLEEIVDIDIKKKDEKDIFIYRGTSRPEIEHIYRHMVQSEQEKALNKERVKKIRATLPQYNEKCLNGKDRILTLVAEAGGESEAIPYNIIQEKYKLAYDVQLDSNELKKYFLQARALTIFEELFFEEVQIYRDEDPTNGNYYLQLKRPLEELRKMWDEKRAILDDKPTKFVQNLYQMPKNSVQFTKKRKQHREDFWM